MSYLSGTPEGRAVLPPGPRTAPAQEARSQQAKDSEAGPREKVPLELEGGEDSRVSDWPRRWDLFGDGRQLDECASDDDHRARQLCPPNVFGTPIYSGSARARGACGARLEAVASGE